MSKRLQKIAQVLSDPENAVEAWRKAHPLEKRSLRNLLYSEKYAKILENTFDVMVENINVFKHQNLEDSDLSETRKNAAAMSALMHKIRPVDPKCYLENDIHSMSITAHAIYYFDPGFSVKCDITFFLFAKTVYYFASQNPVQQEFVRKAMNYEFIGCFGLTELGHGSNAKAILTQAIYDKKNKQFIINSPNQQAMKFWIGAAAEVATMSVIWAQLVIDGKQYGPHPFVVPIRDPKTHLPFKGVTIGDCGPKNGSDNIDNGYLLFQNYRIPQDNALDRLSGVDQHGNFRSIVEGSDRLFGMYMSPLSAGRGFVTMNAIAASLNAMAIAVRFTSQRRQFGTGKKEQLLLDYPSMRYRLMPYLASLVVYLNGGLVLMKKYDTNVKELLNPRNKMLNELHAINGPCKAKSSWLANRVITQCREACGGHGYSSYSGLGRLYHGQDINTTWQGDNNMLLQQTTKYILKIANKLSRGKTFQNNNLSFLTQTIHISEEPTKEELYSLQFLANLLKVEVTKLAQQCISSMVEKKSEGVKKMDIWNQAQPYFGNSLSLLYGDVYYIEQMILKIEQAPSQDIKSLLQNSTRLWAFTLLEEQRMFNLETRKILQQEIIILCDWLTPRSISLLDELTPPKQITGSVFADENGDVMKSYVTALFSRPGTFDRIDWHQKFLEMRNSQK